MALTVEISDGIADAARKVREHVSTPAHETRTGMGCLYCLNLTSWIGEMMVRVVAQADEVAP